MVTGELFQGDLGNNMTSADSLGSAQRGGQSPQEQVVMPGFIPKGKTSDLMSLLPD